jgi:hypothetical protein
MAELLLPKQIAWVRFPSPAPRDCHQSESLCRSLLRCAACSGRSGIGALCGTGTGCIDADGGRLAPAEWLASPLIETVRFVPEASSVRVLAPIAAILAPRIVSPTLTSPGRCLSTDTRARRRRPTVVIPVKEILPTSSPCGAARTGTAEGLEISTAGAGPTGDAARSRSQATIPTAAINAKPVQRFMELLVGSGRRPGA